MTLVTIPGTITVEAANIRGELWNGYVQPLFTAAQVRGIASFLAASTDPDTPSIDEVETTGGVIVFMLHEPASGSDTLVAAARHNSGPEPLFPLGAGYWRWELATATSTLP